MNLLASATTGASLVVPPGLRFDNTLGASLLTTVGNSVYVLIDPSDQLGCNDVACQLIWYPVFASVQFLAELREGFALAEDLRELNEPYLPPI